MSKESFMSIRKALLSGLLSFILFLVFVMCIGGPLGSMIYTAGDPVILSYHMITYIGLATICGMMVTLFCFTLYKIEILQEEINNNKEQR